MSPRHPDDDLPLDPDDVLVQCYLDGTLDRDEHLRVELRLAEDPDFAARVAGYASLFCALDQEGAARSPAPLGIAEAAVAAWRPDAAQSVDRGFVDLFGGLRPALALFAAADAVLAGLLVAVMVARGPANVATGWLLSLKDIALYLASIGPGADQALTVLPSLTVAALLGLAGLWTAGRRIYRRGGNLR